MSFPRRNGCDTPKDEGLSRRGSAREGVEESSSDAMFVDVRGLCVRLRGEVVLRNVDLRCRHGSTTAMVGPSGCGKTTLLRAILGLVPAWEGETRIDGVPMGPRTARSLRQNMGYVVQEGGLFPHLSCEDNVTLMARHLRWKRERIRARLAELLLLVQLNAEDLVGAPASLSGGQRQRVALMRALFLDPALLLLDEPLGALDPVTRFALQRDLRALVRKLNKTLVMVTHDMSEAAYLADDVVFLQHGAVREHGPMNALLSQGPRDPMFAAFLDAQRRRAAALFAGGNHEAHGNVIMGTSSSPEETGDRAGACDDR